jgi:hydroxymethylglutaryl-CoA lyase
MTESQSVRIVEVGPRDGLQNEKTPVGTADKFAFIVKLAEAGIRNIELTSFVKPSAIPQLADAAELVPMVQGHAFPPGMNFSCLVPNLQGLEKAIALGVKEIALFLATSDAFSKRNINATVAESVERVRPVAELAKEKGLRIRGYVSTVYGCPYGEEITPGKVVDVSQKLLEMGAYEISLGDTTGIGTPPKVREVLRILREEGIAKEKLAMHFHDTRGLALANVLTSYELGIRTFDASAGGLGGCPYAKGASGNVATEDLVYLFDAMGAKTGIDIEKLWQASEFMLQTLGRESPSKLHRAMAATRG